MCFYLFVFDSVLVPHKRLIILCSIFMGFSWKLWFSFSLYYFNLSTLITFFLSDFNTNVWFKCINHDIHCDSFS